MNVGETIRVSVWRMKMVNVGETERGSVVEIQCGRDGGRKCDRNGK